MRILNLAKGGLNKMRSGHWELKAGDLDDSIKSLTPGEWCILTSPLLTQRYIAFINPLIDDKYSSIQVVFMGSVEEVKSFDIASFLTQKIQAAHQQRMMFLGYEQGARIFYGQKDGLPGLIIDMFCDINIIQINTAGLDRYRDLIAGVVKTMTGKMTHFLDNASYREKESLPTFVSESPVSNLMVAENGHHYEIRPAVMQKVGFYYDHRENRLQLKQLLPRMKNRPWQGLDLFCYVGAWGINALAGGASSMTFVDQGDFELEVKRSLQLNSFVDRGNFVRQDVFKFLDAAAAEKRLFDLLLCDPPAFAKSVNHKPQALEGYSKLHRKVFKLAAPGALLAFSSCTQYISHDEFQKNVHDAAIKENKRLRLLYNGLQGWDHPVQSQSDRANYIKSFFYLME